MTTDTSRETSESLGLCGEAEANMHRSKFAPAAALLDEALQIAPGNPLYMSLSRDRMRRKGYQTPTPHRRLPRAATFPQSSDLRRSILNPVDNGV